ncbi:9549_t:CDS:2, partial [Funneliformis geosporum]
MHYKRIIRNALLLPQVFLSSKISLVISEISGLFTIHFVSEQLL